MTLILGFLKSQWRTLLPIIMILAALWYVQHLISSRESIKREYAAHIASDKDAETARRAEIALKEVLDDNLRDKREAEQQKVLAQLEIKSQQDLDKLNAKIKELYNAKTKPPISDTIDNYGMQRDYPVGGFTGSETPGSSSDTSAGRECDATRTRLRDLEQATAVTTADFNTCSQWITDVCLVHTCGAK